MRPKPAARLAVTAGMWSTARVASRRPFLEATWTSNTHRFKGDPTLRQNPWEKDKRPSQKAVTPSIELSHHSHRHAEPSTDLQGLTRVNTVEALWNVSLDTCKWLALTAGFLQGLDRLVPALRLYTKNKAPPGLYSVRFLATGRYAAGTRT